MSKTIVIHYGHRDGKQFIERLEDPYEAVEDMPVARITEAGIKMGRHSFISKERRATKGGGEEEVTVVRRFEREWLMSKDGHSYISYQAPDRFEAVLFHPDAPTCQIQAGRMLAKLLDAQAETAKRMVPA